LIFWKKYGQEFVWMPSIALSSNWVLKVKPKKYSMSLMNGIAHFSGTTTNQVREYVGSVSQKGMITIPQAVRRRFKIKPKGKVIFRMSEDAVEIKPMSMALENTFGSVEPINRPENFKQLRNIAIEEHIDKVISKMNQ
jgi:AbrB family looped-hinge helix DNA binding protein